MRSVACLMVVAAGCADATGIVLTVVPDPQSASALAAGTSIEVYVGLGDVEEGTAVGDTVRVHIDDGGMQTFTEFGEFTAPVEVLLNGRRRDEAFWVAVRVTTADGRVVGEGGVTAPLMLVDGKVFAATATVFPLHGTTPPNCPGFDDGAGWHFLVSAARDDDCDADGEIKDNPDCDDFDKAFKTTAQDTLCDGVDHTCGANPFRSDVPCVSGDGGGCFLGSRGCDDAGGGVPTNCIVDTNEPVPLPVCAECADAMNVADLADCLPGASTLQASCRAVHVVDAFCLPPGQPVIALSDKVWWQDGNPQATGHIRWLPLGDPMGFAFEWVDPAAAVTSGVSTLWPPSPAILWDGVAMADTQVEKFAIARTNAGVVELWEVDFDIRGEAECPVPNGTLDCPALPVGAGLR